MRALSLAVLLVLCLPLSVFAFVPFLPAVQEARRLQKEGKYLEAQKLYEETLADTSLAKQDKGWIRRRVEALNMEILFSKFETPESQLHTVVAGDSLYAIAKKYHTTIDLIKKSNGLHKDVIIPGMKLKVITGEFSILVDKSSNILYLKLNDKVLTRYRVATGTENGTPTGDFKIASRIENPTWYKAGAVIAPGAPDNSLGTRWLGFDYPGYGIHGTIEPESIGKQVTSGCVRMINKQVEELYIIVPEGTKVTIKD